jgi:hypothetical protein
VVQHWSVVRRPDGEERWKPHIAGAAEARSTCHADQWTSAPCGGR